MEAKEDHDLSMRLAAIIGRLQAEADRRVALRAPVEARWLDDLRQYHGVYDEIVLEDIRGVGGSEVFLNTTAPKTDALAARLGDLLFPTDDRNWGIGPTPVPELKDQLEQAQKAVDQNKEDANLLMEQRNKAAEDGDDAAAQQLDAQMRAMEEQETAAEQALDKINEIMEAAKKCADLMQDEIEDQLVTCDYQAESRKCIASACKIGLGYMKGPIIDGQGSQRWRKPAEGGDYQLTFVASNMPAARFADPWAIFPDPAFKYVEDGDGVFERHLMTAERLRREVKMRPDINKDVARQILSSAPVENSPSYMVNLRSITSQAQTGESKCYHIWEYTGSIEPEDMATLWQATSPKPPEVDLLASYHVRIWFSQGKVLSFALHPLDSNEPIYSAFTIREDETTVYGYGIPWIIRNPQRMINGAARMMLDNSGLSTGPQIFIDKDAITPQDGKWKMTPRKIWLMNSTALSSTREPIKAVNIQSNQNELASIISMSTELVDQTTGFPALAQGEQGTGVTKTAQGMALLMNSANVSFRRLVKVHDDCVTVPLIRRFYHWNMQFSKKEEIKGDLDVFARGAGVLLVREMQATNMLMIAQIFGDHPVYGKWIKHQALLEQIMKAHSIPKGEVMKTEREYKEDEAKAKGAMDPAAAAQQAMADATMKEVEFKAQELQAKVEMSNQEWAARREIAKMMYDAGLEKATATINLAKDKLEQDSINRDKDRQVDERQLAVEVATAAQSGIHAQGVV